MSMVMRFLRDESGANAIEYGLIASFVSLIIISSLRSTGTKISAKFLAISNNLN